MPQTILVTGATDGIGRQTALELAHQGARVIVHGRQSERVEQTVQALQTESGNTAISGIRADFASLDQVRRMARTLREQRERIDILINNAGLYQTTYARSKDGYELTWAVNHLAPFLLTLSLVNLMRQSSAARIVNVASMAHADRIDWDNLNAEKTFNPYGAYALSKLANILFTYQLAQKLKSAPITVNCLHPGVIDTKLLKKAGYSGRPVSEGARTSVFLATSPDVAHISGRYFVDDRPHPSAAITTDQQVQRRLWQISAAATGIDPPDS